MPIAEVVRAGGETSRRRGRHDAAGPGLLFALIATRRAYTRQGIGVGLLLAIVTGLAVVSYATLGALVLGTGFRPAIEDTPGALYFAIVTLATVGYGDIVPVVRVAPSGVTVETDHVVHGDAAEDEVLERAGVRDARLLIAASDDDSENAMASLAAKDLAPDVRVLAVAGNPAHIQRLKRARADVVFAPATVGGRLLAALAEGRSVQAEFQDLVLGEL